MRTALLPDGTSVACVSALEARSIHNEVLEYFEKGLTVAPGETVVDIGANVGLFALEVCRRTDHRASVICYEPIPQIFLALQSNLGSAANVRCFPVGVADREGRMRFTYYPSASASSTAYPGQDLEAQVDRSIHLLKTDPTYAADRWLLRLPTPLLRWQRRLVVRSVFRGTEVGCPVTTVSRIIRQNNLERIDLLKLDAEGAEVAALEGIAPEDWPRVRRVAVEVHELENDLPRVEQTLSRNGLRITEKFFSYGSAESGSVTLYAEAI